MAKSQSTITAVIEITFNAKLIIQTTHQQELEHALNAAESNVVQEKIADLLTHEIPAVKGIESKQEIEIGPILENKNGAHLIYKKNRNDADNTGIRTRIEVKS